MFSGDIFMKYAFLFLALIFTQNSFARTITSFNDSPALMTIAQFMIDNSDDMSSVSPL